MSQKRGSAKSTERDEREEIRSRALWEQETRLVKKRIGETPTEFLRWIINFLKMDLDSQRSEELTALAYDLRSFPAISGGGKGGRLQLPWPSDSSAIPKAAIRKIQDEVSIQIKRLITDPSYRWRIPAESADLVYEKSAELKDGRFRVVWNCRDEVTAIITAAIHLLLEPGQRIRTCQECRDVFLAHGRQDYCSTACSQRMRDRRRFSEQE